MNAQKKKILEKKMDLLQAKICLETSEIYAELSKLQADLLDESVELRKDKVGKIKELGLHLSHFLPRSKSSSAQTPDADEKDDSERARAEARGKLSKDIALLREQLKEAAQRQRAFSSLGHDGQNSADAVAASQAALAQLKKDYMRKICLFALGEIRAKIDAIVGELECLQSTGAMFLLAQSVFALKRFLQAPTELLLTDEIGGSTTTTTATTRANNSASASSPSALRRLAANAGSGVFTPRSMNRDLRQFGLTPMSSTEDMAAIASTAATTPRATRGGSDASLKSSRSGSDAGLTASRSGSDAGLDVPWTPQGRSHKKHHHKSMMLRIADDRERGSRQHRRIDNYAFEIMSKLRSIVVDLSPAANNDDDKSTSSHDDAGEEEKKEEEEKDEDDDDDDDDNKSTTNKDEEDDGFLPSSSSPSPSSSPVLLAKGKTKTGNKIKMVRIEGDDGDDDDDSDDNDNEDNDSDENKKLVEVKTLSPNELATRAHAVNEVLRLWVSEKDDVQVDDGNEMLKRLEHEMASTNDDRLDRMREFTLETIEWLLDEIAQVQRTLSLRDEAADLAGSAGGGDDDEQRNKEDSELAVVVLKKLANIRLFLLRAFPEASDSFENRNMASELCKLQLLAKRERIAEASVRSDKRELAALHAKLQATLEDDVAIETELRALDRQIAVLVSYQSRVGASGGNDDDEAVALEFDAIVRDESPFDREARDAWVPLLAVLRWRPRYLATLMPLVHYNESDKLCRFATGCLYSDPPSPLDEVLLLELIDRLMSDRFEQCADTDEFLRANSYVTQVLSGYGRRQAGLQHLDDALRDAVEAVVGDADLDLELSPERIYRKLHPDADTVQFSVDQHMDAQIRSRIAAHGERLLATCRRFFGAIVEHVDSVPFGMRFISKRLMALVDRHFPLASDDKRAILLGAFLFLRWFNPAIVHPETYGVTELVVSPAARRNLTLVAKVLQNMVNHCPYGEKEAHMMRTNRFIIESKPILQRYLFAVADVGDTVEYYQDEYREPQLCGHRVRLAAEAGHLHALQRCMLAHRDALVDNDINDPLIQLLANVGAEPELSTRARSKRFVLLVPPTDPEFSLCRGGKGDDDDGSMNGGRNVDDDGGDDDDDDIKNPLDDDAAYDIMEGASMSMSSSHAAASSALSPRSGGGGGRSSRSVSTVRLAASSSRTVSTTDIAVRRATIEGTNLLASPRAAGPSNAASTELGGNDAATATMPASGDDGQSAPDLEAARVRTRQLLNATIDSAQRLRTFRLKRKMVSTLAQLDVCNLDSQTLPELLAELHDHASSTTLFMFDSMHGGGRVGALEQVARRIEALPAAYRERDYWPLVDELVRDYRLRKSRLSAIAKAKRATAARLRRALDRLAELAVRRDAFEEYLANCHLKAFLYNASHSASGVPVIGPFAFTRAELQRRAIVALCSPTEAADFVVKFSSVSPARITVLYERSPATVGDPHRRFDTHEIVLSNLVSEFFEHELLALGIVTYHLRLFIPFLHSLFISRGR
jgi:GTPase-activator protein for Ras-like GTPase